MNKFLVSTTVLLIAINSLLADKQSALNLLTLRASCRAEATNPEALDGWKLENKSLVSCYLKCFMESSKVRVLVDDKFDVSEKHCLIKCILLIIQEHFEF
jgi:hypothetical protein